MTQFLTTHRLYLTPLSPIHIGCGEDFEPTNYIIEDGLLYGFDPSRAALDESQRNRLLRIAREGKLPAIQRFFLDHKSSFKPFAQVIMPVCRGVASLYKKRLGTAANIEADGKQVFNQLEIERHVHTGPLQQPFIPGSSFKGALRTAWLDDLNDDTPPHDVQFKHNGEAKSSAALETRLLNGDFDTSPLRLLKVADLMPQREPEREVLFAVNRKKQRIFKNGELVEPKGVTARKDCIIHGQYRLFAADLSLPALLGQLGKTSPRGKPLTPASQHLNEKGALDLHQLARHVNDYHRPHLERELRMLNERGLIDPSWQQGIEQLLAADSPLARKMTAGKAFLVRIGRYGSAESKTLSGEGVAKIKIMGAKGSPPTFESTTKTVWLAAQEEDAQQKLLPFGWAVVEIDPAADSAELRQWCERQHPNRANMADIRAALNKERLAEEEKKRRLQQETVERAATAEAERKAIARQAEALASMSPNMQEVEKLRLACRDLAAKLPPHGNYRPEEANPNRPGLYHEADRLIKAALAGDWLAEERSTLADVIEQELSIVIARWDKKEQRKKLKLNALRGQA